MSIPAGPDPTPGRELGAPRAVEVRERVRRPAARLGVRGIGAAAEPGPPALRQGVEDRLRGRVVAAEQTHRAQLLLLHDVPVLVDVAGLAVLVKVGVDPRRRIPGEVVRGVVPERPVSVEVDLARPPDAARIAEEDRRRRRRRRGERLRRGQPQEPAGPHLGARARA